MRILLKNLRALPYSLDIGEFEDSMVRELLAPQDLPGDTIDIGGRVNPWDLNVQKFIRGLVTPPGSTTVLTPVVDGYQLVGSPPGQVSATFLQDPDDLVFLFTSSGGSGITAAQHQTLRQLIHFVDEGPAGGFTSGATKVVTGGLFPTDVTWWDQDPLNPGAKKIVQKTIDRSDPVFPPSVTWQIYDTDGVTVLQTLVDAITYLNAAETQRVRTIS